MAKEVQFAGLSTATHYFTVKNAIGEWRRNTGAAFEAYNAANWTDYDFAATEYGASSEFSGDFPVIAAGVYNVSARRQVGGTPAESDPVIAGGLMYWSGTVLVPMTGDAFARLGAPAGASVSADISAVKIDTAEILLDTGTNGVVISAATASAIAASWGSSVVGNGRTRDYFLQGGCNKIEFDAAGTSFTVFGTDDLTPLYTGTSTRNATTVGPLRSVDPA